MKVVQVALRAVADDKKLSEQGELMLPLIELAEAYNKLAHKQQDFFELSEHSGGRELKIALAGLRMKDKLALLQVFQTAMQAISQANHTNHAGYDELDEPGRLTTHLSSDERLAQMEQEERIKFRSLARKVALFAVAPIPPFIAGTWFVFSWQKGALSDSVIANGLMTTVTEIFKVIFTN